MKTRAAVLWEVGQTFEIAELDLDEPKDDEVLIRYVAAGLCHSDEHLRHGDIVPRFPIVGGHEGAGIIEKIGPGVTRVQGGRPRRLLVHPVCGHCRWCATGQPNLCDLGRDDPRRLPARRHVPLPRRRPGLSAACACSARSASTR